MLRKIRDFAPAWNEPPLCQHPDHNFPGMIVLEPGVWEWECPNCGKKTQAVVPYQSSLSDTMGEKNPRRLCSGDVPGADGDSLWGPAGGRW